MSVSPFNWLEASYFYYRPNDLAWEGNLVRGHFLDKGFNIKFIYRPDKYNLPNIAVGLDDFAGTGLFSREYIIVTKKIGNVTPSIGIGWGKYIGENSFDNPLSSISSSLSYRPMNTNFKTGGTPSSDQWFRGEAAFFGGVEYKSPLFKGLSLKLEYDPFDYNDFSANNRSDALKGLRAKDKKINIGASYSYNQFLTIDASYIKGNAFNLSFSLSYNFGKGQSVKQKFDPDLTFKLSKGTQKNIFYINLLENLNKHKLFLQTSTLNNNGNLDLTISTSDHRNAIRSSSYASYIANKVAMNSKIDLSKIKVTHINAGVELNNITYIANHLKDNNITPIEIKIRNTSFDSGNSNDYLDDEFKPNINFPVIFSSLSPSIVSHIGNPEKFYFGGLNLQHISEIQFNRNLLLSTELNTRIYGNFQDTIAGPGSNMQHVRTDLVDYLKEDDAYITRMQLDYIWSPYKDTYAKVSGGLYETMFGGFGGEVLYKPFNKNFNIGAELFYVKQRSFKQRFNFRKYSTTTGHINFSYRFAAGVDANLSFGRYLAKDDGYTFDIGRTTSSGFRSGIYFTRTNVSAELFGEGSFDKGFYFQFPLDLFSNEYNGNYSTIKVSPLTRDGGAKLIHDKDLKGLIYNSSYNELVHQWDGFLNWKTKK